ncbi:mitochondrial 2-oxoglutarate/malate carrier protein [Phytophthora cinnamomi]|uniref:mitochondrial 2-oxoglutarate/malate carrier protein n=1 Tax=Phytophthora cinnamomi TaxID=4785 RepID=UPI00355A732F|nr:mitochondrial 2-oxoglutarate/malate carrier protein [Phytophthora cinnamomi]
MQVDPKETPPPNALLLLVSGDGIPLLVRPYGDVRVPPSAVVGVASALFHAARRENGSAVDLQLLGLETKHRSVVYEMTPIDMLLVFASDKPCDGCPSTGVMTRRMLRTVFAALLLFIGQRNLRDWDASKLRAAISNQVEVLDAIVTQFQIDPRFVFGRPVRDVVQYRELDGIDIGKSGSLMQGAWLENGELVGEYFHPDGPKILDAKELMLLTVLGECVGRKESNYTHHIGRIHLTRTKANVKVVIRNSSRGPLITFIGIFRVKAEEDKILRDTADRLLSYRAKARVRETGCPLQDIPSTLICAYASRLGDTPSPSCRTLFYLNSAWETVVKAEVSRLKLPIVFKDLSRNFWWRELCRFAAHRQFTTGNAATMPSDFKREDESLTFLQHVRGPIQFVSLCIGPVPVSKMVAIGDSLALAMLNIQ